MMRSLVILLALAVMACGKKTDDKSSSARTAAPADAADPGPPCAEVAAHFAAVEAGDFGKELAEIKPTSEQVKLVASRLEAHCNEKNWHTVHRKCVKVAKDSMAIRKNCFKEQPVFGEQVAKIVLDSVAEFKAAK